MNLLQMIVILDPGYLTTSICMVQAAYVLMAERDKLPPGYVMIEHIFSVYIFGLP